MVQLLDPKEGQRNRPSFVMEVLDSNNSIESTAKTNPDTYDQRCFTVAVEAATKVWHYCFVARYGLLVELREPALTIVGLIAVALIEGERIAKWVRRRHSFIGLEQTIFSYSPA
jgi:hypothetical protein